MRKSILAIGLSLMTLSLMAQNREIRRASRALDSGNHTEAMSELNNAEKQLDGAKDNVKAEFYYLKAKTLYSSAPENLENVEEAVSYLKKAKESNPKSTTQNEIQTLTNQMVEDLVNSAIEDQNASKNISAADKLMLVFEMDEANNQQYLYYAASNYHSGDALEEAMEGYKKLMELGYTGVETQYFAVEKETGEKTAFFGDKVQRDLMVQSGAYTNPTQEVTDDVTPQILQYMSYIYIHNNDYDKAIEVVNTALESDPENTHLLRAKADVLYQLGEKEEYRSLMQKITSLEPNNPDLFFNLAVSSAELGETEEAIGYYNQAIELNPDNYAANLNAAILILSKDEDFVKEMNELGMSAADNKKYQELQKDRENLMKTAVPYLERALKIDDSDSEVKRTLANIYYQIGEDAKADKLLEEIKD